MLLGGLTLLIDPALADRYVAGLPEWAGRTLGVVLLAGPWLYTVGSLLHFKPLRMRGFELVYRARRLPRGNCSPVRWS